LITLGEESKWGTEVWLRDELRGTPRKIWEVRGAHSKFDAHEWWQ
jgi:hypothetical protein